MQKLTVIAPIAQLCLSGSHEEEDLDGLVVVTAGDKGEGSSHALLSFSLVEFTSLEQAKFVSGIFSVALLSTHCSHSPPPPPPLGWLEERRQVLRTLLFQPTLISSTVLL